jgi:protein phosphatase
MSPRPVAAAGSDIGRVRERNEDSYLVMDPLFAVADGMGGHRGGEVASRLALETIEELFARREGDLAEEVRQANRAVFERSTQDRSVAGMGTTLTAALLEADHVRLVHVGDSRAYLLREGSLRLLTEDHTLVHRMVLEGELTRAEAEVHPHRNILTRVLGVDPDVRTDDATLDILAGDRLLLCSDGLTGMLPEARIEEILRDEPEPGRAVERLIREANDAGGVDNITAIVIDLIDTEHPEAARGSGSTTEVAAVPGVGPTTEVAADAWAGPSRSGPGRGAEPALRAQRPGEPGSRSEGPARHAVWIAATIGLLVLASVGFRVYLDSQWYVGVSDGRVAIYRGIPAQVAGFELHHVVSETQIPAEAATSLVLYRDLEDGITADDREEAEQIVEQIRLDTAIGQPGQGTGGQGTSGR